MPAPFDPTKLSVAEQVAVLRNLKHAAAAILLDIDPRTLRDKSGRAPRNPRGTYSGPDLSRGLGVWRANRRPTLNWLALIALPLKDTARPGRKWLNSS